MVCIVDLLIMLAFIVLLLANVYSTTYTVTVPSLLHLAVARVLLQGDSWWGELC